MIVIKSPEYPFEWELYYDLRYRILREPLNQPRGSEKNDEDATGIHFALFDHTKICAIARLDSVDETSCQVRFVAVETQLQGSGYGKQIMNEVENKGRLLGKQKMVLHARDYAVVFYSKLGYQLIEPSYKLFGTLQHFLMEKQL